MRARQLSSLRLRVAVVCLTRSGQGCAVSLLTIVVMELRKTTSWTAPLISALQVSLNDGVAAATMTFAVCHMIEGRLTGVPVRGVFVCLCVVERKGEVVSLALVTLVALRGALLIVCLCVVKRGEELVT